MTETHRSWLDTITRSATHLLGIINDIITLRAARTGIHLKQELVRSCGGGTLRGGGSELVRRALDFQGGPNFPFP